VDAHSFKFDRQTPAEWRAQADRFERMAEHFCHDPRLSASFSKLARDAREKAAEQPPWGQRPNAGPGGSR
jgi:hypothetical protein